jgi:hypothetical protein
MSSALPPESPVGTDLIDQIVYRKGAHAMTTELIDRRDPSPRDSGETRAKDEQSSGENGSQKRARNVDRMLELARDEHILAAVQPLWGTAAVVVLTVVAAGNKNGDAKELLAIAITAVTTLAAASGGHAAGRIKSQR